MANKKEYMKEYYARVKDTRAKEYLENKGRREL